MLLVISAVPYPYIFSVAHYNDDSRASIVSPTRILATLGSNEWPLRQDEVVSCLLPAGGLSKRLTTMHRKMTHRLGSIYRTWTILFPTCSHQIRLRWIGKRTADFPVRASLAESGPGDPCSFVEGLVSLIKIAWGSSRNGGCRRCLSILGTTRIHPTTS